MSAAYYNDIDGAAAHVLECLIAENIIAPGIVDRRSIRDVQPSDLDGFAQCHFFAGGGLWSVAARLAGYPDDKPIWTGSCPCQPFSVAGKGAGIDDVRHLWPDFFRLIRARRPAVVMGEQVAGKAGRDWFHGVRSDLEGAAYAGRAVDVPALAVDAPHIRQRLYWLGVADAGCEPRWAGPVDAQDRAFNSNLYGAGGSIAVADADEAGRIPRQWNNSSSRYGDSLGAAHGRNGSAWSNSEWIVCHDGKARRTKPGLRLLVDGMAGRIDLWRIAGNSIVPQIAAEVIRAFLETEVVREAA